MLLRDQYIVSTFHPMQKVGERIGRDDRHIVSVCLKVVVKCQSTAYSVTVWIEMEDNANLPGSSQDVFNFLNDLFFQSILV